MANSATTLTGRGVPRLRGLVGGGVRYLPAEAIPPPMPRRRADLVVRPFGDDGGHVVKDPRAGSYFNLGPAEAFLLLRLDGRPASAVRGDFERAFGEPLTGEDLDGFVDLARANGFLDEPGPDPAGSSPAPGAGAAPGGGGKPSPAAVPAPRQSILYWRRNAFDPDPFFSWLEPRVRFVWTPAFAGLSLTWVALAVVIVCAHGRTMFSHYADFWRWEVWLLVWLTMVAATTLHEFAHGLTCKHFGGEVREVGFLMMFFIPCLYCNVSDAWLFREKSKRLYVTLAGGWCDLLLWATAVFAWRLTPPETLPNYLACAVVAVCGVRSLFNFNPLIKLDGYYLLSDALGLPNLRQRAWDVMTARARWLLWGAPRPAAGEPRGRFLLAFGVASWAYGVALLSATVFALAWLLRDRVGPAGTAGGLALGAAVMRGMFDGFNGGEVTNMLRFRHGRTLLWCAAAVVVPAALVLVPMEDRADGSFQLRSTARAELRAPVAAFLAEVRHDEGEAVRAGALVVRLDVPDLASRVAQKRAEIAEAEARLRLLRMGPRHAETDLTPAAVELDIRAAEAEAAEAQVARLREEVGYLERQQARLLLRSDAAGVVVTPRLREQVGRYYQEGELVCSVEDPARLEAEVVVDEHEAARVNPGRPVTLKARAAPFAGLAGRVVRVAPAAVPGRVPGQEQPGLPGEVDSTVSVYCTVDRVPPGVRPGMTGHARIACGRRSSGAVLFGRAVRYLRTEFWW